MSVTTPGNPDVTNALTPEYTGDSSSNSANPAALAVENSVENARISVSKSYINPALTPEKTVLNPEVQVTAEAEPVAETAVEPIQKAEQQFLPPQFQPIHEVNPVYAEQRTREAVNNFEDWYAAAIGKYRDEDIARSVRNV